MKTISPRVYENLDPKQRVVACIEALARDDETERRRLVDSCPRSTYRQTDRRFADTMDNLLALAMAVEADLKECVLRFFFVKAIDLKEALGFLQDYADLREAWQMTLTAMGIDGDTMASAGPPPSPVFELVEGLIPNPHAEKSGMLSAEMLDLLEPGER